ncbi:MAG: phasin family protein [Holosporales bacterium]
MAGQSQNKSEHPFNAFRDAMPKLDMESVMAANKRNIEAFQSAQSAAMSALKTIGTMQAQFAREMMEEAGSHVRGMMSCKSFEEGMELHNNCMKKAMERGMSHAKELGEVIVSSQKELARHVQEHVKEGMETAKNMAKKATKH